MFRFYSPSRPFLLLPVNRAKIEAELCGLKPEARLSGRRVQSKPLIIDMETWLVHQRARVSAKAPLGEALKYIAKYWNGLCLFLSDGQIELDNNSVEGTHSLQAMKQALITGPQSLHSLKPANSMPLIRKIG